MKISPLNIFLLLSLNVRFMKVLVGLSKGYYEQMTYTEQDLQSNYMSESSICASELILPSDLIVLKK